MVGTRIAFICIACLTSAGTARAETFTFEADVIATSSISVANPPGPPILALSQKGTATLTSAGGTKSEAVTTATGLSATEGDFTSRGVIQATEKDGAGYGITWWCSFDGKSGKTGDCWGRLIGETGRYKGRHGTATWHVMLNGDKDHSVGVGQWND